MSEKKVRQLAAIPVGFNIFRAPLGQAKDRLNTDPLVRGVQIHRRLPDEVSIEIQERQPVVTLKAEGRLWEVDGEGVPCRVVPRQNPRKMLIVSQRPEKPILGQPIKAESFRAAMRCADFAARRNLFLLQKIEVDQNDNLCLNIDKGTKVKLGRSLDLSDKLSVLEMVWRDPKVRNESEYLDLTYPLQPARLPRWNHEPSPTDDLG